jgi:hypothetical protein
MMSVMINRFRWHQVLLGNKAMMERAPGVIEEKSSDPSWVSRMVLNLAPAVRI